MQDWSLVYSTAFYAQAAIIEGRLAENNIPVQVLNKQDSMYNLALTGNYEVYVPTQALQTAKSLLASAPQGE